MQQFKPFQKEEDIVLQRLDPRAPVFMTWYPQWKPGGKLSGKSLQIKG